MEQLVAVSVICASRSPSKSNSDGIDEFKHLLFCKNNLCKRVNKPNSDGMKPDNLLSDRSSLDSRANKPNSVGMKPDNWFLDISRLVS